MARIGHSGLPFKPHRRRLIFAYRGPRVVATPKAKQARHEYGFSPGPARGFRLLRGALLRVSSIAAA
jgi:hypothetical protein